MADAQSAPRDSVTRAACRADRLCPADDDAPGLLGRSAARRWLEASEAAVVVVGKQHSHPIRHYDD